MADLDPMDRRLRAYADRWRADMPPAPPVDVDRLASWHSTGRIWWVAGLSAAAVVAGIVGGSLVVGRDEPAAPPTPAVSPGSVVPWAPLPATHPQIPTTTVPASPDPAEAVGKPACRASDLRATAKVGPAAGTFYLSARLTLVGAQPCRLEGYPKLDLLDQGRRVDIPLQHQTDDSVYRDPVLVSDGHPALLRLSWGSAWCTTPVHNDTIRLVLADGSVSFPGFGGSPSCYVTGGRGPTPIMVEPFAPLRTKDAELSTPYADVAVTGDLDLQAEPGATLDLVVTMTSRTDLPLDPCPDYRIIQSGEAGPHEDVSALNCAAVPYRDENGRPYLPAGTPVRFAMRATAGVAGDYKFSWVLDTVDHKGAGGTLTVLPGSATGSPQGQPLTPEHPA